MAKSKLNTKLGDDDDAELDENVGNDDDFDDSDMAPDASDEDDDDVNYTMGNIQVSMDEDEVTVLPDAGRPGDDENWEADFNLEDKDEFLDQADYEEDDSFE
jgi:hypothetical protein